MGRRASSLAGTKVEGPNAGRRDRIGLMELVAAAN
jgi:hypothetical protein